MVLDAVTRLSGMMLKGDGVGGQWLQQAPRDMFVR